MLLLAGVFSFFPQRAYAEKADPNTIQVTQPDGSVITIQKHGDEFLNWTTSGGRLVKQGIDGFYYLAQFSSQGIVEATATRVRRGASPQGISTITPPAAAFERARVRREEFARMFSGRSHLSRLNAAAPAAMSSMRTISSGNKKFLTILVQFSDLTFTSESPQSDFFNLFNLDGYSENEATGSVWNYFHENSSGIFDPQFDVIGPVTLSGTVSYYGSNDEDGDDIRPREMVVEAVDLAEQLGVDFSQYDNDDDGYIDNIFIIYAGLDESSGGPDYTIWPHAWGIYNERTVDGVITGRYACSSEMKGSPGNERPPVIGTICHEFGHVLGLPDFYDTDYAENGQARGLGIFALMASGNHNDLGRTPPYFTTIERLLLDWFDNDPGVIEEEGDYSLGPVAENICYMSETANDGEFFLYEYRRQAGWDAYIPSGLLIYHIDMSENDVGGVTAASRWNNWNGINAYASHQCCDLVEAVYPEDAIQNNTQIPFPGSTNNTSFTESSSPAAVDHAGNPTGTYLNNIVNTEDRATFSITKSSELIISGVVSDPDGNPVAGAAVILSFEASNGISPATAPSWKSAENGIRISPQRSLENVSQITTNAQGAYSFTTQTASGRYIVTVSKQDYHTAEKGVSGEIAGNTQLDFTLFPIVQFTGDVLKKHNAWEGRSLGYGEPDITIYGAVGFSTEELVLCQGKRIQTISFQISGSSATEVGVFVTMDSDVVLDRKVDNPVFGTMMTVDVSSYELIIPEGKLVKIGCYVKGSDYGYPIAIDEGPMVPMGGYVARSITGLTEPWSHDRNIMVSATVENVSDKEITISGRVTDEQGVPVTGVTMSLFYDNADETAPVNAPDLLKDGGPIRSSSNVAGTLITTVVTDQQGAYTFTTETRDTGVFFIQASKTGYYLAERKTPASHSETITLDFTMIPVLDPGNGVLNKHGLKRWNIGSGTPGGAIYGAVGFTAQEMAPYTGYIVNTISCQVNGSSAAEVGVFAFIDQECVLTQVVSNPSFGTMMNVDVTDHELVIPAGKPVYFGYYVKDCDNGYPLTADEGPMVPMGGYADFTMGPFTTDWKEQHDLDRNIMVSAIVGPRDNQLFSSGYYMILNTSRAYRAGDKLILQLNDDPSLENIVRPNTVAWFFNDQPHNTGDVITLTQGSHTVKVVLTFDNYTQTIVSEIKCLGAD